ncbi:hypothetical protein H4R19_006008, partial [Coemansia spiralis]
MPPRVRQVAALALGALALVSMYILAPRAALQLCGVGGGPPASEAQGKPWGIRYFLPMAEFTDTKWLRMNTILNKAVRVCDNATLKSVGSKAAADMRCDLTVTSETGWEGLCSKTRAMLEHICKNDGLGNNEFF